MVSGAGEWPAKKLAHQPCVPFQGLQERLPRLLHGLDARRQCRKLALSPGLPPHILIGVEQAPDPRGWRGHRAGRQRLISDWPALPRVPLPPPAAPAAHSGRLPALAAGPPPPVSAHSEL